MVSELYNGRPCALLYVPAMMNCLAIFALVFILQLSVENFFTTFGDQLATRYLLLIQSFVPCSIKSVCASLGSDD
jgi:hypothetical protein